MLPCWHPWAGTPQSHTRWAPRQSWAWCAHTGGACRRQTPANSIKMWRLCFHSHSSYTGSYYCLYSDKGQRLCGLECPWSLWLINRMVRSHSNALCWMNSSISRSTAIWFSWDIQTKCVSIFTTLLCAAFLLFTFPLANIVLIILTRPLDFNTPYTVFRKVNLLQLEAQYDLIAPHRIALLINEKFRSGTMF